MDNMQDDSVTVASYLMEHDSGTIEVWVRRIANGGILIFQPVRQQSVSGSAPESLDIRQITRCIALDEWVASHPEIFSEGRTARQQ